MCVHVYICLRLVNECEVLEKELHSEDVFAQTSDILSVAWFPALSRPKVPLRQVSPLSGHLSTALIYLDKNQNI